MESLKILAEPQVEYKIEDSKVFVRMNANEEVWKKSECNCPNCESENVYFNTNESSFGFYKKIGIVEGSLHLCIDCDYAFRYNKSTEGENEWVSEDDDTFGALSKLKLAFFGGTFSISPLEWQESKSTSLKEALERIESQRVEELEMAN